MTSRLAGPISDYLFEGIEGARGDYTVGGPYLAHYTSIETLEAIFRTNQLWFGNPLVMNDYEEARLAFDAGLPAFKDSPHIQQALGSPARTHA